MKKITTYWIFILFVFILGCEKEAIVQPEPTVSKLKSSNFNYMPNSGGYNTTDFEGKSNQWTFFMGQGTICNKNIYWDGSFITISSVSQFCLISPPAIPDGKQYHTLTLKYKSTTTVYVVVQYTDKCTYVIRALDPQNKPTVISIYFWAPAIKALKFYNHVNYGGYFQIDEVNIF